jgi:hypothetical protein
MENSAQLGVSDTARAMAHDLLRGAGSWIKPPYWYRALTTAWLPDRFRIEFGLPFDNAQKHAVERAKRRFPRIYHRLPAMIRFVGPWHEAQERLRGKDPGLAAQISNRFWIGQSHLPSLSTASKP